MTKIKGIILALLASMHLGWAQQSFSLKSAEDQTPITYASISREHNLVTTSDSLGKFTIQQEDLHLPITIKALGYKNLDSFSRIRNHL